MKKGDGGTFNYGYYSKVPTSSHLIDKRAETDKRNLTFALAILSHIDVLDVMQTLIGHPLSVLNVKEFCHLQHINI